MDEWNRFELGGHVFVAYLPSAASEAPTFTLSVLKSGTEIRRETLPLLYPPIFGPDAEDVARLDDRVEAVIKELGLK